MVRDEFADSVTISPLTGTDAAEREQSVLAHYAEPRGGRRSHGVWGWVTHDSADGIHTTTYPQPTNTTNPHTDGIGLRYHSPTLSPLTGGGLGDR